MKLKFKVVYLVRELVLCSKPKNTPLHHWEILEGTRPDHCLPLSLDLFGNQGLESGVLLKLV